MSSFQRPDKPDFCRLDTTPLETPQNHDVTLRQSEAPYHTKRTSCRLAAATRRSRLDTLALANLHSRLVVDSGRSHAFLDLSCHCQECLLDIGRILGRSFEERNSEAVGELL